MAKNIGMKHAMRQHMIDKHTAPEHNDLEKVHGADPLGKVIIK